MASGIARPSRCSSWHAGDSCPCSVTDPRSCRSSTQETWRLHWWPRQPPPERRVRYTTRRIPRSRRAPHWYELWAARWDVSRASYRDRKSTRLNSSHSQISYAVFRLKKKNAAFVAKVVRCVDLHPAVIAAAENTAVHDNVHVVLRACSRPPFRPARQHVVYSISLL